MTDDDIVEHNLDPRLARECIVLGKLKSSLLLLVDNSLVPWFILVPQTALTEIYELPRDLRLDLVDEINMISAYIKKEYPVDKLNVASIGNIVDQLHVHVVGRSKNDYCWPGVVWGNENRQAYTQKAINKIIESLEDDLPGILVKSSSQPVH